MEFINFGKILLFVSLLPFLRRMKCESFCGEFCNCHPDIHMIHCSGVDFIEALSHNYSDEITNITKSLEISYFDQSLRLDNDTLKRFYALEKLAIVHYGVTFISEYVFQGLYELQNIRLSFNSLKSIPIVQLSHLNSSLEELHLLQQKITNIANYSFIQLGNLREMTIKYNQYFLEISAYAFTGLANLTYLCLSENGIMRLHSTTFKGLTNLQELDLSHNLLVTVPPALNALKTLIKLDLSYNHLLEYTGNFQFLAETLTLQTLQMGYCAISEISPEAVDNLNASNLNVANFDGNPFNCTEGLCSFVIWYLSMPEPSTTRSPFYIPFITLSPPLGKGPYRCKTSGLSFKEFSNESCLPTPDDPLPTISYPVNYPTSLRGIAFGVICIVFLLVIVSVVIWKHRLKRNRGFHFGFNFQQRADYGAVQENDNEYMFDAYVSHHEDDRPFVQDEMLPRLEEENGFDLCVSFRNFRLGSNLLENVSSAQDVSRAIIFIINERFMQNGQCKLELEMASRRMLEDEEENGRRRLILIMKDVLAPDLMNNTLRMLLNHVAYLEWDPAAEERCWGQLVATLRAMEPARNDPNEQEADIGENNDCEAPNEIQPI
ncbi:toll-like receptor Tollo [Lytechinus variegatus]|uniref:toll-like receptor Tollo n=1 Tax=Lytechinus variegatus TaxID=7654 RepID=UPI001BB26C2A|nr:toll-like receptor Tollo [Lytechinus variegatus]